MGGGALVVALLMTGPIVTFEWQEPVGGVAPDRYEVEFIQEHRDPEILMTDVPAISLSPELGRSFELRVRACQAQTCGSWSELSQPVSLNRSADFDEDGGVGIPDYSRFGALFGSHEIEADLDGDTVVGLPDFSEFSEHFGACVGKIDVGGEELPAYVPCQRQGASN